MDVREFVKNNHRCTNRGTQDNIFRTLRKLPNFSVFLTDQETNGSAQPLFLTTKYCRGVSSNNKKVSKADRPLTKIYYVKV